MLLQTNPDVFCFVIYIRDVNTAAFSAALALAAVLLQDTSCGV